MFSWKRSPFYRYERAILDAVVGAAAPPLAELLRVQVDEITYVQRTASSPEVNFYAGRKGGDWTAASLFPNLGEVRIAEVVACIGGREHKGAVDAVSGHLFGLTLRPAVTDRRNALLEAIQVRVVDPSNLMHQRAALDVAPLTFVGQPEAERNASTGRWTPCTEDEVYVIALQEADWAVLAHGPPGRLLIGRRSEGGDLFRIVNVESDEMTSMVASAFRDALREAEMGAV